MQSTDISVSAAPTSVSVSDYSLAAVLEQLKRLYSAEVIWIIEEIDKLLPSYRAVIDNETYECDHARVMLVAAYMSEGPMDVHVLATSQNYLLKKQRLFATALQRSV